ncbi:unnamed protein product [Fraxinus pennsylvanica]|uniref:Uncharacterized protein n=1 Tax=Fraxinus pennsylvanica TaxID=56036 RepID=A0AAD1ZZ55_9LAMI|nr:unnamed protein product [Fraxinus pennsylvanica]
MSQKSNILLILAFLKHRYYGNTIPFGSTEEAMRNESTHGYFNSAQAIADNAECAHLVDMIMSELKLDKKVSSLKIEYVEMSPIRISNDSSMKFPLELKRRDHRVTAYALLVSMSKTTIMTGSQLQERLENEFGNIAMFKQRVGADIATTMHITSVK